MARPTRIFVPTIYGEYEYGTVYYGGQWITLIAPAPPPVIPTSTTPPGPPLGIPPGYGIGPVTAQAVDYETIMLLWNQPTVTAGILDFRILRNRYGFPVDQNDGTILLDTANSTPSFPTGNQYFDLQVIPGQMHYYGFYILLQLQSEQLWYRAGFAATLMPVDLNTTNWLLTRIPEWFADITPSNEITTSDAFGNSLLDQFISIFGWGEDYLQTQLNLIAQMNNPQVVPVNMLTNLAATYGFPYYSEISPGITRNAMMNNAALIKERGSLEGIEAYITQLTSWGADIRVGYNQMLEDDQGDFLDPDPLAWNSSISYDVGEIVNYQGFTYQSNANNNLNQPPSLQPNPFFAGALGTGWNTSNSTVTYASDISNGPFAWNAQVTNTSAGGSLKQNGTNNVFTATTNAQYTVSVWLYSAINITVQIGFDWLLNGVLQSTSQTNIILQGLTWTNFVVTQTSPATNCNQANVNIGATGNGNIYSIQAALATYGSNYPWTPIFYSPDTGSQAGPTAYQSVVLAATGVAAVNPNEFGVYVNVTGGTVTNISVSGANTGITSGQVFVPDDGTLTITYSVAPTLTTTAPYLLNPTTGWLNTWEPLIDGMTVDAPTSNTAMTEMRGVLNPVTIDSELAGQYVGNALAVFNNSGSTSNIELRSISRTSGDITLGSLWPNTGQVIGDGVPVLVATANWNATTEYLPNNVVLYQGSPFLALKASTGIAPPTNGIASNEWQPVGYDQRVALMLSGYTSQIYNTSSTQTYATVPYVVWFDEYGGFINAVYMPTSLGGGAPLSIVFDSFALPANWGSSLASTTPDIIGTDCSGWVANTGAFTVNAFNNGAIIPAATNVQSIATVTYASANAFCGVTLAQFEQGMGGTLIGLVMRYSSTTSYTRVDQNGIYLINGGAVTLLAAHSAPANPGDRLTCSVTSGNVYTAYINGFQVSTATNSTNSSAAKFGVIADLSIQVPAVFGKTMPAAIQKLARRRAASATMSDGPGVVQRSPQATGTASPNLFAVHEAQEARSNIPARRRKHQGYRSPRRG